VQSFYEFPCKDSAQQLKMFALYFLINNFWHKLNFQELLMNFNWDLDFMVSITQLILCRQLYYNFVFVIS